MGRIIAVIALFWLASHAAAGQPPPARTFDTEPAGTLPKGFELAQMRQDTPGRWLLRRMGSNGYLVHEADAAATGFALALSPDPPLRDVEASVRLRLGGGERAGGLVWRYASPDDYHAAVLDLARAEIVLFRVSAGNRIFLEREDGLELDSSAWHTLKVVHEEWRITVSLGGIRVFQERDRRYDRDTPPGRSGVIATGASEVWFDDLRIEAEVDRPRRP